MRLKPNLGWISGLASKNSFSPFLAEWLASRFNSFPILISALTVPEFCFGGYPGVHRINKGQIDVPSLWGFLYVLNLRNDPRAAIKCRAKLAVRGFQQIMETVQSAFRSPKISAATIQPPQLRQKFLKRVGDSSV